MAGEAPRLYPLLRYRDAPRAITFLEEAFGFRPGQVIANEDGTIAHAELGYAPSVVMLGSEREDPQLGRRAGLGWVYVAVDDADAHCEHARAAGAEIVTELYDTDYGSREYAARDLEGNHWTFGTYRVAAESAEPTAPATPA
jgi:uncharacterized glyoxalase superfamily protein PhnB